MSATSKRMKTRVAKILVWSSIAVFSALLLREAFDFEISPKENGAPDTVSPSPRIHLPQTDDSRLTASTPVNPDVVPQNQEWCDTEGNADLANHSVFQQFSNWLTVYENIASSQPIFSRARRPSFQRGGDQPRTRAGARDLDAD